MHDMMECLLLLLLLLLLIVKRRLSRSNRSSGIAFAEPAAAVATTPSEANVARPFLLSPKPLGADLNAAHPLYHVSVLAGTRAADKRERQREAPAAWRPLNHHPIHPRSVQACYSPNGLQTTRSRCQ